MTKEYMPLGTVNVVLPGVVNKYCCGTYEGLPQKSAGIDI
jgi:hypothetical protein